MDTALAYIRQSSPTENPSENKLSLWVLLFFCIGNNLYAECVQQQTKKRVSLNFDQNTLNTIATLQFMYSGVSVWLRF